MSIQARTFLLGIAMIGICALGRGVNDPVNEVVTCPSTESDLANALAQISELSRIPIVAEISQPLPKIEIPAGNYVLKDLLLNIARQAPQYDWEIRGKVIHFYGRRLRDAKFNFLNLKFPEFILPPNLSEFKLTFPIRENGLLNGFAGGGMIVDGFGDPELESSSLRPSTLRSVTGREVLFHVAEEAPTFLTIVVFPNADPTEEQMKADMNRNWFWESLQKESHYPLYVQPAPKPTH